MQELGSKNGGRLPNKLLKLNQKELLNFNSFRSGRLHYFGSENGFCSADNRPRGELKFTTFQFLAKEPDLFFNRAVLFQTALNTVDGMQCRGVVAIERFSNRLQRGIREAP